ncbi:hypothetical protein EC912_102184 [Luteibacter rhizovicinus]|uniref:Uncharacterized protein n=1 Tax=Luteibacter rhizovicinus TaxID=242606 RepID=A0A4V2W4G9_9GAMM|nr:hypothetical protein [Luteibacter rhizovicinus]TCV95839.1 hypothetical protein EC912_102184 [Luteibacter rhizovicinus]
MSAVWQACEQMAVSDEARGRLAPEMAPQVAVRTLLQAGESGDALKLMARLLPRRYVVAWLCQCARGETLEPEDRAGASLAEKWVREPSEANRRAAFEFAHSGGYRTIGAWLAAAAGWSGGSLAPANQETPVPPAEHLTARAAVAALNLLAARDTERFDARRIAFVEHALGLLADAGQEGA